MAEQKTKKDLDSVLLWKALDRAGFSSDNRTLDALTFKNLDLVREFYLLVKDTIVPLVLFTGSTAEITGVCKSDLDSMHGLQCGYGTFKKHYLDNQHDYQINVLLRDDNVPLGFGKLETRVLNKNVHGLAEEELLEMAEIGDDGTAFLSSLKARRNYLDYTLNGQTLHGPSVMHDKHYFEWDKVPYTKYSQWPKQANEWIVRQRNFLWPSHQQITNAVNGGCFLVPVGKPGSPTENIEWRISFSLLERDLVWSWNDTQVKCYVFLKLIMKDVVNEFASEVLSSYHLKTLMFWQIEESDIDMWQPEKLCVLVMGMMKKLLDHVHTGHCPHYFIKEYNLFESKVHGENQQKLLHILNILIDKGAMYCIEQCSYLNGWYCNTMNVATEHEAIIASHWKKITHEATLRNGCNVIDITLRFMMDNLFTSTLTDSIQNHNLFIQRHKLLLKKCHVAKRNVLRIMLLPVYTSLGSLLLSQAVQKQDQPNKEALMAKALYNLENGENCDGLSGKLKLAMFYYAIEQYREAIHVINNALDNLCSRFPEEKNAHENETGGSYNMVTFQRFLMRVPCEGSITEYGEFVSFKGLSSNDAMNSMKYFTVDVGFDPCEMLHMPTAIQYEIACRNSLITGQHWVKSAKFSSLMFCYFMMFMCFYQLKNGSEMLIVMREFNKFFEYRDDFKFGETDYNLLAQCLLMVGDVNAAIRVLRKSFKVQPSYTINAALWILGVHLYRQSCYYRQCSRYLVCTI